MEAPSRHKGPAIAHRISAPRTPVFGLANQQIFSAVNIFALLPFEHMYCKGQPLAIQPDRTPVDNSIWQTENSLPHPVN